VLIVAGPVEQSLLSTLVKLSRVLPRLLVSLSQKADVADLKPLLLPPETLVEPVAAEAAEADTFT
jgi:hypothetical protein